MTIQSQGKRNARSLRALATVTAALGLIVVSGCGSSSSSSAGTTETTASTAATPSTSSTTAAPSGSESSGAASSKLSIEANKEGQLEYNTKSLSAKAGSVSIAFTNTSPVGHNVTIESSSGSTVGATPTFQGATKNLAVSLKPGTYKFFCSVPGHRGAGMEGTITVK